MNNKWKQLNAAIHVATVVHKGQYDRGGKPYILHPLHLMNQLMFDPVLAAIAVLHDVIEDSDYTIDYFIEAGYDPRIVEALELLTHDLEDSYQEYLEKIATNYDAIRVKRKDLQHNSDITRLKGVREKDLVRTKKYHEAFLFLGKAKKKFQ